MKRSEFKRLLQATVSECMKTRSNYSEVLDSLSDDDSIKSTVLKELLPDKKLGMDIGEMAQLYLNKINTVSPQDVYNFHYLLGSFDNEVYRIAIHAKWNIDIRKPNPMMAFEEFEKEDLLWNGVTE